MKPWPRDRERSVNPGVNRVAHPDTVGYTEAIMCDRCGSLSAFGWYFGPGTSPGAGSCRP